MLTAGAVLLPTASAGAACTERVVVERIDEPTSCRRLRRDRSLRVRDPVSGVRRVRVVDVSSGDGTLLRMGSTLELHETSRNSVTERRCR